MSFSESINQRHPVFTILLVDDHPLIRRGLMALLRHERDLCVVGEAETLNQATKLIDRLVPDVILVDLHLGGESGLDVLRYIRETWVGPRSIVVSQYGDDVFVREAAQAGASGYVTKDRAADEVIDAIRAVGHGRRYFATTSAGGAR